MLLVSEFMQQVLSKDDNSHYHIFLCRPFITDAQPCQQYHDVFLVLGDERRETLCLPHFLFHRPGASCFFIFYYLCVQLRNAAFKQLKWPEAKGRTYHNSVLVIIGPDSFRQMVHVCTVPMKTSGLGDRA